MPDTLTLTIETAAGTRTGEFVPVRIHLDGQGNTMCSLVRPDEPDRIIVSGYCLREAETQRFQFGVRSSPQRHKGHRNEAKADAATSRHAVAVGRAAPDATASATDGADITDAVHLPGTARPTHETSIPATFSGFYYLIDLLNILVRCFHASPPSRINGVRGMLQMLSPILGNPTFPRSGVVFAGEGGHAIRRAIYPQYKTHRPETPELLREQIALAIEAVQQLGWPVLTSPGYEADDVLAALALTISSRGGEPIIVSSDKDLRQLLAVDGVHVLDPGSKSLIYPSAVREKFGVDPEQLGDWLALTGDASDGVPGVTGIGPAAATDLLDQCHTLDGVLAHAASMRAKEPKKKRWQTLVEMEQTARLSRELVRLRTECPLPGGWWDWPVDTPCPGWQDWFRQRGLSAVIDTVSRVTGLPAAHPRTLTPIPTSPSVISVPSVADQTSEISDEAILATRPGLNQRPDPADTRSPAGDSAVDPFPLAVGRYQLREGAEGTVLPARKISPDEGIQVAVAAAGCFHASHDSPVGADLRVPDRAAVLVIGQTSSGDVGAACPQFIRDCIAAGLTVISGPDDIVGNYSARTPDGRAWVLMPALDPRPELIVSDQFESLTIAQFRERFATPLSIHHGGTESTEKPLPAPAAPPRDPVPTFRTPAKGALF